MAASRARAVLATGCGALSTLLRRLAPRGRLYGPVLLLQMGVAEALSADVPLAWYRHLPGERAPRFETLRAGPGDVVLAQNLFGRDDREPWDAWRRGAPRHHRGGGPLARSVQRLGAGQLGAVRRGLAAQDPAAARDGRVLVAARSRAATADRRGKAPGAHLKLAAMLLKDAWLDGRAVPKDTFRSLQQRGEHLLLGSAGPASALTAAVLPLVDVAGLRATSTRNARALVAALPSSTPAGGPGGGRADAAAFRVEFVVGTNGPEGRIRATTSPRSRRVREKAPAARRTGDVRRAAGSRYGGNRRTSCSPPVRPAPADPRTRRGRSPRATCGSRAGPRRTPTCTRTGSRAPRPARRRGGTTVLP